MGCWVISGWFVHRRSVGVAGAVGTVGTIDAVDAVDVVGVVVRRSSAASPVQPAACAAGLNQTASIPPESPAFQSICPRHNIKIHSDCPRNQMLPQHRNTSIILRPQTIFKRGNMYACSSAARSLTRCVPILRLRSVFHAEYPHTSAPPGLFLGDSPYFDLIRVRFAHPPAGFPKECLRPLLRGRPVGHPLCSDCGQSKRIRWAISQRPCRRHNRVPYAGEGGESNFPRKLLSPDEVELSPCSGGTDEPAFPRAPEVQANRRAPAENTEAQAPVW